MKALTICQPYAHLIVLGKKRVENREWFTAYRGPLLIHAGKSRAWLDIEVDSERGEHDYQTLIPLRDMAFGAVVGLASLVDCLHIDRIHLGQYDAKYPWLKSHEHANGTWCWVLERVKRFVSPASMKGALGLWDATLGPDALVSVAVPKDGAL